MLVLSHGPRAFRAFRLWLQFIVVAAAMLLALFLLHFNMNITDVSEKVGFVVSTCLTLLLAPDMIFVQGMIEAYTMPRAEVIDAVIHDEHLFEQDIAYIHQHVDLLLAHPTDSRVSIQNARAHMTSETALGAVAVRQLVESSAVCGAFCIIVPTLQLRWTFWLPFNRTHVAQLGSQDAAAKSFSGLNVVLWSEHPLKYAMSRLLNTQVRLDAAFHVAPLGAVLWRTEGARRDEHKVLRGLLRDIDAPISLERLRRLERHLDGSTDNTVEMMMHRLNLTEQQVEQLRRRREQREAAASRLSKLAHTTKHLVEEASVKVCKSAGAPASSRGSGAPAPSRESGAPASSIEENV